ncbi:MAG: hypothetical protein JWM10_2048 [Myxococcaceae bacterium]|nr:hypothetical protein [Myxococcaceae bacterium]
MPMTGVERHWLSIVLPSFLDPTAAGLGVRAGEVDFVRGALAMYAATSPLAQIGMRAALVVAMLSPVFILGRFVTFTALGPAERSDVLARVCSHRVFVLRGIGVLLKLTASMAMFRVASVRARTNHDRRPAPAPARVRVALPVLMGPASEAA